MAERKISFVGGSPGGKPTRDRETYFIGVFRKNKLVAVKIGMTSRGQTARRLRNLKTGSVDTLKLLATCRGNFEKKLHRKFARHRIQGGEFFKPVKEILALIELVDTANKVDETTTKRVSRHHNR